MLESVAKHVGEMRSIVVLFYGSQLEPKIKINYIKYNNIKKLHFKTQRRQPPNLESEKPARRKSGGLFCIYRLSSPEAIRLNPSKWVHV